MMIRGLLLSLFVFSSAMIIGQTSYLSTQDVWLIGPSNVDKQLAIQSKYYTDSYDEIMTEIFKDIESIDVELDSLKRSKTKSNIKRKQKIGLKKKSRQLMQDLTEVGIYISMWIVRYPSYNEDGGEGGVYVWNEIIDNVSKKIVTKEVVKAEETKWVKKKKEDCTSTLSNDCMEMCLVTTPTKYRTVSKTIREKCPDGYQSVAEEEICVKIVRYKDK